MSNPADFTDPTRQGMPPQGYADYAAPRRVDPSTPLYTPWIWIMVLLPLLSGIALLFWDAGAYLNASMADPLAQYLDPGYLLVQGSGVVFYGVGVLFAFLDRRVLLQRGFDRPFHWAWAFLGSVVYIIGRSVVVRSRSGRGLAPIWAYIGVFAVTMIVVVAKIAALVSSAMETVPQFS